MAEVGQTLREAREKRGLTIEDVERELKIRRKFIIALENNQYRNILEDIYVRGFLRNYARFLELDENQLMKMHSGGAHASPAGSVPQPLTPQTALRPVPENAGQPSQSYLRPALVVVSVIVVLGALVLIAVQLTGGATATPPSQVTAMAALTKAAGATLTAQATPPPSPTPTVTSIPTATPTPTLTPTPSFYTGVTIELILKGKSWLQIGVDGQKAFEGILDAGNRRTWHGNDRVAVRAGNAGGVEAVINGQSVGLLGEDGQVVEMEWQKEPAAPAPAATPLPPVTISATMSLTATLAAKP
jgi:cytoskeletal protein RodZ